MRTRNRVVLAGLCFFLGATSSAQETGWPQWRGPLGTGASPDATPPIRWSESSNVRWKVALPGRGTGTPIVHAGLVFVLTAESMDGPKRPAPKSDKPDTRKPFQRKVAPAGKQRYSILALRREDGSVAWQSVATEAAPHESVHEDGGWSASSAVTDGEHVFASFGSRGLFAYDMQGKRVWEKQFGDMQRKGFGEGSSPALHGGTLVVQRDHEGASFLIALDKRTGEERWREARDEPTSWATPLIVTVGDRVQVITSGANKARSYDLSSGELIWECGGLTSNVISTPVHSDGIAYVMSGFSGYAALAIRLKGAKGDITNSKAVIWSAKRNTPYVSSPLLLAGQLYFFKTNTGIFSSLDAKTGASVFGPERSKSLSNVYASPVAAAGRIYLAGLDGDVEVLKHGRSYEVLATNHLDDTFTASPALAGSELYLRGEAHLYCIASD